MNIGGREQAAMAKKKRHSRVEIASKLAQANDLVTQGKPQSEIARTLGVSVMTLHRWRKAQPGPQRGFVAIHGAGQPDRTPGGGSRIAELQLENSRLTFHLDHSAGADQPQNQKSPRGRPRRLSR